MAELKKSDNSTVPRRPMHHRRNFTGLTSKELDAERSKWPKKTVELWERLSKKEANDLESIEKSIVHHVTTTLARAAYNMDNFTAYQAVALSTRDRLISRWNETQGQLSKADPKRVYYLSLEFLLGRSMDNALLNMGLKDVYGKGIEELGFNMEDVIESEVDAALGNGGLGRLAACYMDSLATLDYPAWGYGLRYNYGIFKQRIVDGYQTEYPDYWLNFDNPWELARLDISIQIGFGGHVQITQDEYGVTRHNWIPATSVQAIAYDVPIPGYATENCNNIRLWRSKPTKAFDLTSFNEGNYEKSVEDATNAEKITSVLYPNDNTMAGKELRLKQQYFWTAASLHDIVRRFKKSMREWSEFPDQVAIQLNDTHPTLAIVELQRLLVDEEMLSWDDAWDIVTKIFAFTNHTVLPEAMEKWSVPMFEYLLPRHLQIIFDINLFFLQKVEKKFPNDRGLLNRMSIIEEAQPQQIRMAHLAVVGSHKVNGVAALHSNLIKTTIFKDFVDYYGEEKFVNKTNGITPRRWLHQANPQLSAFITETLGSDKWLKELSLLKGLNKKVGDAAFRKKWMAIKRANKVRLAELIKTRCDIEVSPDALFDVQVKRIHEYKRQFMNILYVIHRYRAIKSMSAAQKAGVQPRVVIFGGKAAPGYYIAKLVIKLINSVAAVVNQDPAVGDLLKVVFIPDYNVSVAEVIVPASDISQHISTAGTEASGTSNMKFVLNGGIIIGTLDGANIEIMEEIGEDNIFIFGCMAHEVEDLRHAQRYRSVPMDPALQGVISAIEKGTFEDPKIFQPLISTLTVGKDFYLISADFASYIVANQQVDAAYKNQQEWAKKSILCTANMGKFSSDRSVKEYADEIWHIKQHAVQDEGYRN
ncbi:glycosyl transferase [Gamsiella multidivaricata]|uniref:glycosyl transferase n=1 Tax=Gamsiella multidivaricata TaxID=101098 RepID=UPI0022210542|nr:glycosyl transferase [Gamsiella multidivaricata]KAI7829636.1 glycosyl transferase [Gamsiella multidivaricata]